jgi:CTP synthase
MGGSMRLGAQEIELKEGSLIHSIYGTNRIIERHRHRYEFNNEFREEFEKSGLVVSAKHKGLVEALEFRDHPFFLGVQFHPEYSSKPLKPHPIFVKLLSL